MPHVIRRGRANLDRAWRELPSGPWRWGRAVARVEGCYLGADGRSLLVAGVVVELGRPLHPVFIVTHREGDTAVHLWNVAPVERTEAVKRFLARVAMELGAFGAGEVVVSNLPDLIDE
jgi:hypothetical protein